MQKKAAGGKVTALIILIACMVITLVATAGILRRPDPEGFARKFISHDGRERSYLIKVPENATVKPPAMIVLHGGGGNAKSNEVITGMGKLADKEGFVLVYPDGTGKRKNFLLTWNAGRCCAYAKKHDVDDVGFISALIDFLISEKNVDPKRVYVTGISNGGMMAYRLACEAPEKIAGIAPVAGSMFDGCAQKGPPLPVAIFHGTEDKHVLYDGGEPLRKFDPNPRIDPPVSYAAEFWRKRNGCDPDPETSRKGNIRIERYQKCVPGAGVVVYSIVGGGHSWPGGTKYLPGADEPTRELDANSTMWEFFEEYAQGK